MLSFILIFILSLFFLVLGAEVFLKNAEKIGLSLGLSPFVIGVTIVAFGTSFPELFTSIMAALMNVTEMIPANVIGSNIANILLVVGFSAILGKKLVVTKNLIDIELPLLSIGTVILIGVIYPWGKESALITRLESIILIFIYVIYLLYTFFHKEIEGDDLDTITTNKIKIKNDVEMENKKPKTSFKEWSLLFLSVIFLTFSSKYLIVSVIGISELLNIAVGIMSILAVAVGTSLPELIVSVKAAIKGNPEVALGNVFGSNVFNSFIVIGVPGLFSNIKVDETTLFIGFPIMILSTLLFVISGISRRIHNWEGFFFIGLYVIFVIKILGI